MSYLIRVTPWEKESIGRRIVCAFLRVAILCAVVGSVLKFLGPPITIFLTARWEAKKIPGVKFVPQPLADYSVAKGPGTTISYFGFEFEVPWNSSFEQKAFNEHGLVQLRFASGQVVTFIVPANYHGLLSEIVEDNSLDMAGLRPALGDLLNLSPYDQQVALLETTPGGIRAFGPRAEAVRGVMLLTIKSLAIPGPGLREGVFSFEFPDKRGFQFGNPIKSKDEILEVFGRANWYVEINCEAAKNSVNLTQPELNRILTSLHAIPENHSALLAPPAAGHSN